jgi:hypothetical protein
MRKLMNPFVTIISTLIIAGFITHAYAAGDYVWEEKFKTAMPKAEQGDMEAQYDIGRMYERGKGSTKDAKKAFEWYSKAANQGDIKSAYKIGRAYLSGSGVKRNYKKALGWFKKSASKKYARAEYYIGVIYENGYGVKKDFNQSISWYRRALDGGYRNASSAIKRVNKAKKTAIRKRRIAEAKAAKKKKAKLKRKARAKQSKNKSTKEKVLAGGWKRNSKFVEYLPSPFAQCKDKGIRVECLSADISRNIGMADINYITKAILFGFKKNGSFKISYRNKVSNINVTDPVFVESGGKIPVSLGWQDAEHKLVCEFENNRSLTCIKNKLRTIKLHR